MGPVDRVICIGFATCATAMVAVPPAFGRDHVVWSHKFNYPISQKARVVRIFNSASTQMYDACDRGTSTRAALSHVRIPTRPGGSVKFLYQHWPTIKHLFGFDDTCDIGYKFFKFAGSINSIGFICLGSCPTGFTIYDRGIHQDVSFAPDICRWELGTSSFSSPTVVIKTPCYD